MNRKKGVYSTEHYKKEDQNNFLKKRKIKRRAKEVIYNLSKYFPQFSGKTVIDIGTADGKLLKILQKRFPDNYYCGLDYSYELLQLYGGSSLNLICGDGNILPFKDDCFDVVISTAVLEHVENPNTMLQEIHRILKSDGILLLTTPDKFWIRTAEFIRIEPPNEHYFTFKLKELKQIFLNNNFKILGCYKFMFFPFMFKYEKTFELLISKIGLDFLLVNQFIIGKVNTSGKFDKPAFDNN